MPKIAGDDKLKGFANRAARILQEIAENQADLKELKAEAKAAGFDPTVLVKAVKYQMLEENGREKADEAFDLFSYYVKILTGEETGGRPLEEKPAAAEGATQH